MATSWQPSGESLHPVVKSLARKKAARARGQDDGEISLEDFNRTLPRTTTGPDTTPGFAMRQRIKEENRAR